MTTLLSSPDTVGDAKTLLSVDDLASAGLIAPADAPAEEPAAEAAPAEEPAAEAASADEPAAEAASEEGDA